MGEHNEIWDYMRGLASKLRLIEQANAKLVERVDVLERVVAMTEEQRNSWLKAQREEPKP
jgi:putative heme iron utilization protein